MNGTQFIKPLSRQLGLSLIKSLVLVAGCLVVGCTRNACLKTIHNDTSEIEVIEAAVETPALEITVQSEPPLTTDSIRTLDDYSYREMRLADVMSIALQNSSVLRELGGTLLRTPEQVRTRYLMRLENSNPRFSREAALSAFDAQFTASAAFQNNDRIYNNSFFAGGTNAFLQDLHDYKAELSKVTASGSRIALRGVADYDSNNAPGNTFNSAWNSYVDAEIRHPLLQGGGIEFNRIAGPNSAPGVYSGLLIARVNSDISQADFELAVRDFVSNVENAYWDLYFAYRDTAARQKAMNRALRSWNTRKAREEPGTETGAQEALAREQFYRFKSDYDEAVAGRLVQGTQSRNGSTGGTLRGNGGLLVAERRLRLLIGLPTADGALIRPSEEPSQAQIFFDWNTCSSEALTSRPELRRQHLRIKRGEMELLAAKNFLNPRLDAVANYRFRGFGDDFIRDGNQGGATPASSVGSLVAGNLQEWNLGVELSVPIGYRQANAAVAHAELVLARDRTVYHEQQREVIHDLGNAVADTARAHKSMQNNLNRYLAADEVLRALEAQESEGIPVEIDRILDAQRRSVDAEILYFRSRAEYAVALKNVHFEKGSLMQCNSVRLVDSGASADAPTFANSGSSDTAVSASTVGQVALDQR